MVERRKKEKENRKEKRKRSKDANGSSVAPAYHVTHKRDDLRYVRKRYTLRVLAHLARAQPPKIKSQNTTYIRSNTSSFDCLIVYIHETALCTTCTASEPSFGLASLQIYI
jgi:hypothetical protein